MGNRASVIIKQNDKQGIEIYGHWAGNNIVNTLPHALKVAEERFDDISYFTRIITHNILDDIADKDKETSAGIEICELNESNHDLNYYTVFIDPFEKMVICNNTEFSFEYIMTNGVDDLKKAMLFVY